MISSDFDEEDETISLVMLTDGDDEKYSVNEMMVLLRHASSRVFKAGVNFCYIKCLTNIHS